jgi:hypothetical protein
MKIVTVNGLPTIITKEALDSSLPIDTVSRRSVSLLNTFSVARNSACVLSSCS